MQRVPNILGWLPFQEVGFYDFKKMQLCVFKAMPTRLKLDGPIPDQMHTRHSLVGLFHHKLMELVFRCLTKAQLEEDIEKEISSLQMKVDALIHLRRTGSVSGWVEINRSAVMALSLFDSLKASSGTGNSTIEGKLKSKDGQIVGRPDYFNINHDRAVLKELKSSLLRDEEGGVKSEYEEQVMFYAILLFDNFPLDQVKAILESAHGESIEIAVSKEQTEKLRSEVLSVISSANLRIQSAKQIDELATPSVDGCSTCEIRFMCPSFKSAQFSLTLEGDIFVLDGKIDAIKPIGTSASDVQISDAGSRMKRSIVMANIHSKNLDVGKRYIFANVIKKSNSFIFSDKSRIYSHD